MRLIKIIKTWW